MMRTSLLIFKNKMVFIHLDERNEFKDEWEDLIKKNTEFKILIWNTDQERDHLNRANPLLDSQLFPRTVISVACAMQKLVDYGGIVIRGEKTRPTRNLKIIMEEWKTLGPPARFTVRGYGFPSSVDKTTIMVSQAKNPILIKYHTIMMSEMLRGKWKHPEFQKDDVSTL